MTEQRKPQGGDSRVERFESYFDEEDLARLRHRHMRAVGSYIGMFVLLIALFFAAINIGSLQVSFGQLINGLFVEFDQDVSTVFDLRFPRIMISMLAGAAIAVSGVLFQAVLKNPLADPGIIGISSGASFVAVLVVALAPQLYFLSPLISCAGGFVAFFLVYSLSWKDGLSPLRIILVGIAVNAMFTGLTSAFGSMGGSTSSVASIVSGSITQKTWGDVATLAPYVAIGLFISLFALRACNLLQLEDKTARALGINVSRTRVLVSCIAVMLASISTAIVGPISFLGLIVPHIGRILVGSDHRILVPFTILLGAFLFLGADTLGRVVIAPSEISAAIVMSVIGGPFFILLLRGSRSYGN